MTSKLKWFCTPNYEGGSLISLQKMLLAPILCERALNRSCPTWPYAPNINTLIDFKIYYYQGFIKFRFGINLFKI